MYFTNISLMSSGEFTSLISFHLTSSRLNSFHSNWVRGEATSLPWMRPIIANRCTTYFILVAATANWVASRWTEFRWKWGQRYEPTLQLYEYYLQIAHGYTVAQQLSSSNSSNIIQTTCTIHIHSVLHRVPQSKTRAFWSLTLDKICCPISNSFIVRFPN